MASYKDWPAVPHGYTIGRRRNDETRQFGMIQQPEVMPPHLLDVTWTTAVTGWWKVEV